MSRKPEPFNGYLDGNGNSAYAARADHTHDGSGGYLAGDTPVLKAVKKTIKVTDWNEKAAEVIFEEGTYVSYAVAAASQSAATAAALVFTSVGTKKLNFGCTTTPEAAIDVYVLYL